MMRDVRLLVLALVATLACASTPDPGVEPVGRRGDSKTITAADLSNATQLNLQDFIAAERPQWLRTADGRAAPVSVYVDDGLLGGISSLRGITLRTVTAVHYYDASAAQQKFRVHEPGPVIQVLTK